MNKDQREVQRKLRILRHAEEIGHVAAMFTLDFGESSDAAWVSGENLSPIETL